MVSDSIVNKIRALANMTTARGASEAEAQTAMEKMQKLLFEHNLSIADISVSTEEKRRSDVKDEYNSARTRMNTKPGAGFKERGKHLPPYEREWRVTLGAAIARYNFCSCLFGAEWSGIFFIGAPDNIEAVKEIWNYAIEQIDRLSYEALKARRKNQAQRAAEGWEGGKEWRRAWLFGCVARVSTRLYETWQELRKQSEASTALVVRNDAAVSEYMHERWPALYDDKPRRGRALRSSDTGGSYGYSHGYAAGDRVDINRPARRIEGA